jgi:hypothetical protein
MDISIYKSQLQDIKDYKATLNGDESAYVIKVLDKFIDCLENDKEFKD